MRNRCIFYDFAIWHNENIVESGDLFQILRKRLTLCFESSDCNVQKMYIIKAYNPSSALAQWGRRAARSRSQKERERSSERRARSDK